MSFPSTEDLGSANSIAQYIKLVLAKRSEGSEVGWFFRGQHDYDWRLLAQIDRPHFVEYRSAHGLSRLQHEERLLEDFIKGARPHAIPEPHDRWEWLALAQHCGLATRLLDWTLNPLAALYFAVEHRSSQADCAVWCYHHVGKGWAHYQKKSPFGLNEVVEFRPAHLTPRITVQGGCFTSQPDPAVPCTANVGQLKKIRICSEDKDRFRRELRKLGIDRASLFPDLDGIAYAINCRLSG